VPSHIASIERPAEKLMTYYTIKAVFATVAFPVLLLILYFRYHTMRYKFDAEGIRMSWGIFFRREIMLNYSRIQDIHLRSSLIERFLGLARIEIQTAAGSSNGAMTLEGLRDHETMRDFLYSRMRGTRDYHRAEEHEPLVCEDELIGTLHEIAGELRAIRMLIEERHPHV
jgi:putative membrane protein